jgi:hypothetical protein
MTAILEDVESRLDRLKSAETNARVRSLANLKGFKTVLQSPSLNDVAVVLDIWQLRNDNTGITGLNIPGAPSLIKKLKLMPANAKIEQYGLHGKKRAGCIFFDHRTGEFLGDTIVERRPKSQTMLDLEDQLIDPKSLALARAGTVKQSA